MKLIKRNRITGLVLWKKGLTALELLASQGPLTVSELTKLLGFNRSAVYRFVATLRDIGYVVQEGDGKFRTTLRMYSFGTISGRQAGNQRYGKACYVGA